jgi:type I restriction enzyme R subunit
MRDTLGYTSFYGPDVVRDYRSPLLEKQLKSSLIKINSKIPQEAISEAIFKIKNYDSENLLRKNGRFMKYLQNNVEVSIPVDGEQKNYCVKLIAFDNVENNEFAVINQLMVVDTISNLKEQLM